MICIALVLELALLSLSPGLVQPQATPRIPIYVEHSGDDTIGLRYAFAVREQLRKSAGFALASSTRTAAITILLATVDMPGGLDGDRGTAVGYSLIVNNRASTFLTAGVRLVAASRLEHWSNELIARLDATLDEWRQRLSSRSGIRSPRPDPLLDEIDRLLSEPPTADQATPPPDGPR